MKNRVLISKLNDYIGKEVIIAGWMHRIRILGKIAFLILRDRTGIIQCVLGNKELINQVKDLQVESVLKIKGTVQTSDKQESGIELDVNEIQVISPVYEMIPVEINKDEIDAHIDTIIDYRPVTLRHSKLKAIFKIQAGIVEGYREYMRSQGFVEIIFPILAGASSEGGAEIFKLDYFGKEATLPQSAQLYKQIMMGVYEGVYGLSYCFRAEKSATTRHLTEFNQFEFELGFIEDMEEIMYHCENAVRHIIKKIQNEYSKELEILNVTNLPIVPEDKPFPRITLKQALEIYKEGTGIDETNEPDLSPGAEKWLSTEWGPKAHNSNFVFVTHYPLSKRPFYTYPNPDNPELSESFDLIGNGSEIVTGGQRVNRYQHQIERLKEKGLNPEDFEGYLMMHKYGIPTEGGFGMGLQRLTQNLLGLKNIREATLFPRDLNRLTP